MPVMADAAHLAWAATLGCLEINPWPVRSYDVDHPDELRMDLDPMPGVPFDHVREVAIAAKDVLEEFGLVGFPKTSGKKGIHVNARIRPEWDFTEVRRAALALAREVERRLPDIATTKWWKEERHGVFLDYNQNARDRTVASAYSVRPMPDARVSTPLDVGRGRGRRARGVHAPDGARPAPDRGRSRRGDRRPCRHARARPRALRPAGARGPGRGAVSAALPEGRGGTRPRATVATSERHRREGAGRGGLRSPARAGQADRTDGAAPHADAADRDRASRDRAGGDGGLRTVEGQAPGGRCRTSSPPT